LGGDKEKGYTTLTSGEEPDAAARRYNETPTINRREAKINQRRKGLTRKGRIRLKGGESRHHYGGERRAARTGTAKTARKRGEALDDLARGQRNSTEQKNMRATI